MVKLKALPKAEMVDMLAGVVDFYVYHPCGPEGPGIPCARRWPRYDASVYPDTIKVGQQLLAYASSMWKALSPEVREAWDRMADKTGLTGKDLMIRGYINGSLL
jgi:hypothetical protein